MNTLAEPFPHACCGDLRGRFASLCVVVCSLACGCSKSQYEFAPVDGTVKFSDGSVPQGEIATIIFQPDDTASGVRISPKPASGKIMPDGSFTLNCVRNSTGAITGPYKVVLNVLKTYMGHESVVGKKFTNPATTPLAATVTPGPNHFNFTVEK